MNVGGVESRCGIAWNWLGQRRSKIAAVILIAAAAVVSLWPARNASCAETSRPPNIIFILTDDLGYGDVGCYGGAKVKTPNIDRLAHEGRMFTDAHSPAAVCGPTRYAVITGRELYRIGMGGLNGKLMVKPGETTLPLICKRAGYATALVGKWHLGYGTVKPNWNGELKPGPLEIGFDSFFGTANTHNEPPQVLVENYRVVNLSPDDPITIVPPKRGSMFGVMQGGKSARTVHEDLATIHTEKAVKFIEQNKDRPFFLYYGTINVHGPITPHKRFQGTSQCGLYGDYIQELDWCVGEVLGTLDRLGLAQNTLVFFTSDNGGVLDRVAVKNGHFPNGNLLGKKTDAWEGGHRVPYLVRWPGHVPAGTKSGKLISLSDTLATCAAVLGQPLEPTAGPDSYNALPALVDQPAPTAVRNVLTMQGFPGGLAIREGRWLLIPKQGSFGFSTNPKDGLGLKPWALGSVNSDYTADGKLKPDAPPGQLYDLEKGPARDDQPLSPTSRHRLAPHRTAQRGPEERHKPADVAACSGKPPSCKSVWSAAMHRRFRSKELG